MEPTPQDDVSIRFSKRKKTISTDIYSSKVNPHVNLYASRWAFLPVLLVVWLAPFLGGSVEPWAKCILFSALAFLLVIYPVGHQFNRPFRYFLVFLALLPLLSFLPVLLTNVPTWRSDLTQRFAIYFPATISPQPWITFDGWLNWLAGLTWIYWLGGQGWTRETRKPLAELFVLGIVVLTVVGLIGYHTRNPLPFWDAERLFGPFPNRNQTANLLSLTFVLLVALMHMAFLKKSRLFVVWALSAVIVGYALIVNYSRAGIILPALGAGIYWFITTLVTPSRQKVWIGLASLILAVALLIASGGEILDRFTIGGSKNDPLTSNFRLLIFQDTLAMTGAHPLFGIGLGNFPYVFPFFRKLAIIDTAIIHPESDWLWLASEVGFPGAMIILGAAVVLVCQSFSGSVKRPHPLRLASAICGALFVFHGFFDVSGHRFGTFIPACFAFALAWPGQLNEKVASPWKSRAIAGGLLTIVLVWSLALGGSPLWPGEVALGVNKQKIAQKILIGQGAQAFPVADSSLHWAPLDWQLYYQRGTSRILEKRDWADTYQDYRRVNYLNHYSPNPPAAEGMAWLSYRPELAALPWSIALARMPVEERPKQYERYLALSAPWPSLRSQLETLGSSNIAQAIVQLNLATDSQFPGLLDNFLKKYPKLERFSTVDQRRLLDVWAGRGDPQDVVDLLQKNPALTPVGTVPLAFAHAKLKNFKKACELLFKVIKPPLMPKISIPQPEVNLREEFYKRNSLATGVALYRMQMQRQDSPAALVTLERLKQLPDAPTYLHYFTAKIYAGSENWEQAWIELADCVRKNHL